jgi:excisionase family DNA binding protein
MDAPWQPRDPVPDGLALVVPPALVDVIVARVAEEMAVRARPGTEPWVGVREAAQHLGCKPQRIYDLVSRRATSGIPHAKEGGRLLFRLSQLDRWLESGGAA